MQHLHYTIKEIDLLLTANKFSQMRQFSKSHFSASWYVAYARGLKTAKQMCDLCPELDQVQKSPFIVH